MFELSHYIQLGRAVAKAGLYYQCSYHHGRIFKKFLRELIQCCKHLVSSLKHFLPNHCTVITEILIV